MLLADLDPIFSSRGALRLYGRERYADSDILGGEYGRWARWERGVAGAVGVASDAAVDHHGYCGAPEERRNLGTDGTFPVILIRAKRNMRKLSVSPHISRAPSNSYGANCPWTPLSQCLRREVALYS